MKTRFVDIPYEAVFMGSNQTQFLNILLKKACINGDADKVSEHLAAGANPNALFGYDKFSEDGKTYTPIQAPLLYFACLGDDISNHEMDPTTRTGFEKRRVVIDLLLNDPRMNVNEQFTIGSKKHTVLNLLFARKAFFHNEITHIEALPGVNSRRKKSLLKAYLESDLNEVKKLLDEGVSPNALFSRRVKQIKQTNSDEIFYAPALLIACLGQRAMRDEKQDARYELIEFVLNDPRFEVNQKISIGSQPHTVLDLLRYREVHFAEEIAQLEDHPRVTSINNNFLLKQACLNSDISTVKTLLDRGADPNVPFECDVGNIISAPALFYACLGRRYGKEGFRIETEEDHQDRHEVLNLLLNNSQVNVGASITVESEEAVNHFPIVDYLHANLFFIDELALLLEYDRVLMNAFLGEPDEEIEDESLSLVTINNTSTSPLLLRSPQSLSSTATSLQNKDFEVELKDELDFRQVKRAKKAG
jgi:hypothetical protein